MSRERNLPMFSSRSTKDLSRVRYKSRPLLATSSLSIAFLLDINRAMFDGALCRAVPCVLRHAELRRQSVYRGRRGLRQPDVHRTVRVVGPLCPPDLGPAWLPSKAGARSRLWNRE